MNWQTLLAKIGLCDPPLPELVRASADRAGVVNRRAFLQIAGAAVAGLAIDPERLLWTPGQTVSVTVVEEFGVSFEWVTREVLRLMEKNLKLADTFDRSYDRQFIASYDRRGARLGETVALRIPQIFAPAQPVTLTEQFHVALDVDPGQRAFNTERDLAPIAAALADRIREKGLNVFSNLPVPPGVEQAAVASSLASGLSVRGIKHTPMFSIDGYDEATGEPTYCFDPTPMLRFDILGGRA